jgi:hypothetical protein
MIDPRDFDRPDTHEDDAGGAWRGMSGPDTPDGEPDTPLRRGDAHEKLMGTDDLEFDAALRPSVPGPTLPRPAESAPDIEVGTGVTGKGTPLPESSPLYHIDLSAPAGEDDEDTAPTLRERAVGALADAQDALRRGAQAAGDLREVASRYEPPARETAREVEAFTRSSPKIALALAFGAGVMVAKGLRKLT